MMSLEPLDTSDQRKCAQFSFPCHSKGDARLLHSRSKMAIDGSETIEMKLRGGLAPWQSKLVHKHIDTNIEEKICIDELASLTKLSKSHFFKAFRKSHGVSPYNYVMARRVKIAMAKMALSNAPLCQIALDLGYTDQAHLSRVFRRATGTTPSAWRAKQST